MEQYSSKIHKEIDDYFKRNEEDVRILMLSLNISKECARDLVYLKLKGRHNPRIENHLIQLHSKGTPPKISEFGIPKSKLINLY